MGALSADHLVQISDDGIKAMAEKSVIAMLLPVTTFFLRKDTYAPARKMIEQGCTVGVATDFNPGSSMTQNMQLAWSVAALKMAMMPAELLWASTLVPARSLEMDNLIGSIEEGKQADLILLDIPNLEYLPYHVGINHVKMTIKKGNVVYTDYEKR
jgi:imidazolonepropionase